MIDLTKYLPVAVIVVGIATVILSELVKKIDKKNIFKGYKVIFPLFFSLGFSWLLRIGRFFANPDQVWFYWTIICLGSICFFEIILKKAKEKWDLSL